jgi:glucose dehydrogenase
MAGAAWATRSIWSESVALAAQSPQPGSADWSRYGFDLHNTRFNGQENTLGRGTVDRLKLKWRHRIGAPIQSTPLVIGDTLFVGAWDGHYYGLDSRTGERKWQYDAGVKPAPPFGLREIRSSATYDNGKIFFGTGAGELNCVDAATGRQIWKTQVDPDPSARISSTPNILGNRVFIGTSADHAQIACLDAETGAVRWRFYVNPPDRSNGGGSVWTCAAVDEEQNIVYNVTGNPRAFHPPGPLLFTESILANDLETGELLWYDQVRNADPFDLDFSCHPMIFDATSPGKPGASRNCVGAGSKGGFYTWDRYTGELLWKVMLTNRGIQGGLVWNSTAVAYNKVYAISNAVNEWTGRSEAGRAVGLSESVTAALHAFTGEIVWWRHNKAMNRSPACVANGVFYQTLIDGSLEALDAETGKTLWSSRLASSSHTGVVIANGELYTTNGEPNAAPVSVDPNGNYFVYAYSIDGQ